MKRDLIKNTMIIAIGKFSTQIISFLLLPLYTSILSTTEFGTFDVYVTIAIFAVPIITLLMEESMFRFLVDAENDEQKRKIISHAVLFSLISTVFWLILFALLARFALSSILMGELPLLLYIVSCVLINLANAITRGMSNFKLFSISNVVCGIVTLVLNVLFIAVFRWGVVGLLFATFLANTVTALFIFMKVKVHRFVSFKVIEKKTLKEMIAFSIPLVPNNISWTIINLSNRLFVVGYCGVAANGIFSVASKFPNIMYTTYGFFYTAWKESASKALKIEAFKEYYDNIHRNIKNFLFAVATMIIAVMPFVFNLLVNKNFNDAYLYIPILMVAMYYGNLGSFYGGIFVAYKDTKIMGKTTIIGAIINIAVAFILIRYLGIWGACVSTLIANIVVNYYRRIKIERHVKLDAVPNSLICYVFLAFILITYYLNILAINIIALAIMTAFNIYLNKEIIDMILNKLKKKKEVIS